MTPARRRILLAAAALAAAPLARAQKPGEKRVLGVLSPHPKPTPEQAAYWGVDAKFRELGWRIGENLVVERPEDPRGEVALAEMAEALVRKRVDVIFADADMSADLIDAAVANGAKGIVIAGVGNGNMNRASVEAAARAVDQGVVVVRSSRVATGSVGRNVELNDDELGFIASDELNPQKSRILLSLALLGQHSPQQIQQMYYTY